jgi:hypothetical protein
MSAPVPVVYSGDDYNLHLTNTHVELESASPSRSARHFLRRSSSVAPLSLPLNEIFACVPAPTPTSHRAQNPEKWVIELHAFERKRGNRWEPIVHRVTCKSETERTQLIYDITQKLHGMSL